MKKLRPIILFLFNLTFIFSVGCINETLNSTQTETTITTIEPTEILADKIVDYTDDCIQESPNPYVKFSTHKIAFVSDRCGDRDIYIMNTDGSDVKRITDHPAFDLSLIHI